MVPGNDLLQSVRILWKKVSHRLFRSMRTASLALETAAVLPLFLFGMITMISYMDLYAGQSTHLTALCDQAKQAGVEACNGEAETVCKTEVWTYRPYQLLGPLHGITFHNQIHVRCWNGRIGTIAESSSAEEMVYVTEHGSVYHTDASCSYLQRKILEVPGTEVDQMRNHSGARYHACESCSWASPPGGNVYVTEYGTRYHNSGSCSQLTRSIQLVERSEVSGMHECSKCRRTG